MYYLQKYERQKYNSIYIFTNGLRMLFAQPYCYSPKKIATRLCFIFCAFSAIIFSTVVSTQVVLLGASQISEPQIETIQEIIKNNFTMIGDQFAYWKISEQNEVKFLYIYFDYFRNSYLE